MPCFVRYTEAVRHDHVLLSEVQLPKGLMIVFDRGYVDYFQYRRFTEDEIYYVTRLKDNAAYVSGQEYDIPCDADSGILKDEEIILSCGEKMNANTVPDVLLIGTVKTNVCLFFLPIISR